MCSRQGLCYVIECLFHDMYRSSLDFVEIQFKEDTHKRCHLKYRHSGLVICMLMLRLQTDSTVCLNSDMDFT